MSSLEEHSDKYQDDRDGTLLLGVVAALVGLAFIAFGVYAGHQLALMIADQVDYASDIVDLGAGQPLPAPPLSRLWGDGWIGQLLPTACGVAGTVLVLFGWRTIRDA